MLLENYIQAMRSKNVSEDVIAYLESIENSVARGRLIRMVMSNSTLSVADLKKKEGTYLGFRHSNDAIHKDILDADPTKNKNYYKIIHDWYEGHYNRIREDIDRLHEVLTHYGLKRSLYSKKNPADYKTFQEMESECLKLKGISRNAHIITLEGIRGIPGKKPKKIYSDAKWDMWETTTPEQAAYFGTKTRWCTGRNCETAKRYLDEGPLYVLVNRKTHEKYQSTYDFSQVMDSSDTEASDAIFDVFVEIGRKIGNLWAYINSNDDSGPDDREFIKLINLPDNKQILSGRHAQKKLTRWVSDKIMYSPPNHYKLDEYIKFCVDQNIHLAGIGSSLHEKKYRRDTIIRLVKYTINDADNFMSFLFNSLVGSSDMRTDRFLGHLPFHIRDNEIEKVILTSPKWNVTDQIRYYLRFFPPQRWAGLEDVIRKSTSAAESMRRYQAAMMAKGVAIPMSHNISQRQEISTIYEFADAISHAVDINTRNSAVEDVLKNISAGKYSIRPYLIVMYMNKFNFYPVNAIRYVIRHDFKEGYILLKEFKNKSSTFYRQFYDIMLDIFVKTIRPYKITSATSEYSNEILLISILLEYMAKYYGGAPHEFTRHLTPEIAFHIGVYRDFKQFCLKTGFRLDVKDIQRAFDENKFRHRNSYHYQIMDYAINIAGNHLFDAFYLEVEENKDKYLFTPILVEEYLHKFRHMVKRT